MNIAKTRVITPLFGYNERSRNGATNTIPAPDIRPAYTGANAMVQFRAIPTLSPKDEDRFWSKVAVPYQPSGCWEWIGRIDSNGYGRFNIGRIPLGAHRVACAILVGDQPKVLDHLCRNILCVNPDHLEYVSVKVNSLRGVAPNILLHLSGRCALGHTEFRIDRNGRRHCRECECRRQREYQQRKRMEQAA